MSNDNLAHDGRFGILTIQENESEAKQEVREGIVSNAAASRYILLPNCSYMCFSFGDRKRRD